jgi:hypothetical protein
MKRINQKDKENGNTHRILVRIGQKVYELTQQPRPGKNPINEFFVLNTFEIFQKRLKSQHLNFRIWIFESRKCELGENQDPGFQRGISNSQVSE